MTHIQNIVKNVIHGLNVFSEDTARTVWISC